MAPTSDILSCVFCQTINSLLICCVSNSKLCTEKNIIKKKSKINYPPYIFKHLFFYLALSRIQMQLLYHSCQQTNKELSWYIMGRQQEKNEMFQKHICPQWCKIQAYLLCSSKTCPKQVRKGLKNIKWTTHWVKKVVWPWPLNM